MKREDPRRGGYCTDRPQAPIIHLLLLFLLFFCICMYVCGHANVHMYVCGCANVHMYMCECANVHVQRPEVDVRCLFSLFSAFYIEARSLTLPRALHFV